MSFKKEFIAWKKEHGEHGSKAHSRFCMMKFVENIASVSDDFVFKGSNLLWHYIKIKRPTMDLDLSSATIVEHEEIREILESSLNVNSEISYSILSFKEVEYDFKIAAKIILGYKTLDGASNKFGLDIVYGLATDIKRVSVFNEEINAASIENIIIDKLSAFKQFGSGSTRGRDFDDLWHIAVSGEEIRPGILKMLSEAKDIELKLNVNNISDVVTDAYLNHLKSSYRGRNKSDIPTDLYEVFDVVNDFLSKYS